MSEDREALTAAIKQLFDCDLCHDPRALTCSRRQYHDIALKVAGTVYSAQAYKNVQTQRDLLDEQCRRLQAKLKMAEDRLLQVAGEREAAFERGMEAERRLVVEFLSGQSSDNDGHGLLVEQAEHIAGLIHHDEDLDAQLKALGFRKEGT